MTCKQLGGACDEAFRAESFEEMGELSKKHAMAMAAQGDEAHIAKMDAMREVMGNPEAFVAWQKKVREAFDSLPDAS